MAASAAVSFGKHEPPNPGPACRNFPAMRRSSPIPRAISCTSAPHRSQRSAISLMKVDLGREKSIGCVFDELRGAPSGKEHRRLIYEQRSIKLAHHVTRPLVIGANHDAIGVLEILNGGALAQKLRI